MYKRQIHTYAGIELRLKMHEIMAKQGHEEETGKAKITSGYNLPAKYILHTVGPIILWKVTKEDEALLASCYTECLTVSYTHLKIEIGIGYQVGKIYRNYCWDIISIMMAIMSTAIVIYLGEWIKAVITINIIVLLLLVHVVYIGIRCYVKDWREEREYY